MTLNDSWMSLKQRSPYFSFFFKFWLLNRDLLFIRIQSSLISCDISSMQMKKANNMCWWKFVNIIWIFESTKTSNIIWIENHLSQTKKYLQLRDLSHIFMHERLSTSLLMLIHDYLGDRLYLIMNVMQGQLWKRLKELIL